MNAKRIFLSAVVVALLAGSQASAKSTAGATLKVAGGGILAVGASVQFFWVLKDYISGEMGGKGRDVMFLHQVFDKALIDGTILLASGYILGKGLKDLKKIAKKRKRKWKKK